MNIPTFSPQYVHPTIPPSHNSAQLERLKASRQTNPLKGMCYLPSFTYLSSQVWALLSWPKFTVINSGYKTCDLTKKGRHIFLLTLSF